MSDTPSEQLPVGQEVKVRDERGVSRYVTRTADDRLIYRSGNDAVAAAVTINNEYLALKSPTAAQNTAQIQHLTRLANALIEVGFGVVEREPFPR